MEKEEGNQLVFMPMKLVNNELETRIAEDGPDYVLPRDEDDEEEIEENEDEYHT